MQIGAGYDIPLSTDANKTQFVLSLLFPTLFWSKSTFNRNMEQYDCRAGVALKFGQGKNIQEATDIKADKQVSFSVDSPSNVPGDSKLTEIFPLKLCILTMDQVKYLTVMFY
jgi:hypothetical protein